MKLAIKVPSMKSSNPWMLASLILAILLILVSCKTLWITKTSLTSSASMPLTGRFLSADEVGEKVVNYINENLLPSGMSCELIGVEDMGSIYKVRTKFQGKEIDVYATKDGKYLLFQAVDMSKKLEREGVTQPRRKEIPKAEKPTVKLFVMSYCPFGLQAEKALLPVIDLLKGKAKFEIRFVDYIMHGKKELDENMRQYCIEFEQGEKYFDYLRCFIETNGNYTACLERVGIDKTKLESCVERIDKKYKVSEMYANKSTWLHGYYPRFPVEEEENKKYGVQGSPTLVINDVVATNVERSPEGFKRVICQAFTTPPEECQQNLSTQVASPGFGSVPCPSETGVCTP